MITNTMITKTTSYLVQNTPVRQAAVARDAGGAPVGSCRWSGSPPPGCGARALTR